MIIEYSLAFLRHQCFTKTMWHTIQSSNQAKTTKLSPFQNKDVISCIGNPNRFLFNWDNRMMHNSRCPHNLYRLEEYRYCITRKLLFVIPVNWIIEQNPLLSEHGYSRLNMKLNRKGKEKRIERFLRCDCFHHSQTNATRIVVVLWLGEYRLFL